VGLAVKAPREAAQRLCYAGIDARPTLQGSFSMKYLILTATAGLLSCASVYAQDPPAVPGTHIDTTVVGSGKQDSSGTAASPHLDNSHDFVAGAPELLKVLKQVKLSPKQQAKVHELIENSDASAADLIEREHDVKQMIAATTPEDPMYAKLITNQTEAAAQWTENREKLRQAVLEILTPEQRTKFEKLQAAP
jgi:Spy/CpxP family protein refolding chaperone